MSALGHTNEIAKLGDAVLKAQLRLGLHNPHHYRPGLAVSEFTRYPGFLDHLPPSELQDLFSWHDGVATDGPPMRELWLKPGFYLFSAGESVMSNRYRSRSLTDWRDSWYPVLTDGAGDSRFCDANTFTNRATPVFYYEPEEFPIIGKIYDSITTMFRTILECYEKGVYYLNEEGFLQRHFPEEAVISRALNRNSDYWQRADLF